MPTMYATYFIRVQRWTKLCITVLGVRYTSFSLRTFSYENKIRASYMTDAKRESEVGLPTYIHSERFKRLNRRNFPHFFSQYGGFYDSLRISGTIDQYYS